jgi:hypothetical protein
MRSFPAAERMPGRAPDRVVDRDRRMNLPPENHLLEMRISGVSARNTDARHGQQ